jgi:hypothetical protein
MNIAVAIDDVEQEALTPVSEAGPAPSGSWLPMAFGFSSSATS